MICLAVTFVVKPGHEDEAIALFARLTEHTRAEPGCRMYLAHRSTTIRGDFSSTSNTTIRPRSMPIGPRLISRQYAKGGLFPIIESRSPELYVPLTD